MALNTRKCELMGFRKTNDNEVFTYNATQENYYLETARYYNRRTSQFQRTFNKCIQQY